MLNKKGKPVKKAICICAAALAAAAMFGGCNTNNASPEPEQTPIVTDTPSDNPVANKHMGIPEYGMNEAASVDTERGKCMVRIKSVSKMKDDTICKVLDAESLISVELEYENYSREPYMYLYAYDFVTRDSEDTILKPYIVFDDEEKKKNSVSPGESAVTKTLIYGINKNEDHIRMEFYDAQEDLEPLFAFELDF